MKRKSKNYRLIVNHTAAKKHQSPESSGSDDDIGPPPRNHRKVRKHKQKSSSSEDFVFRTKSSHKESATYLIPTECDKVPSHYSSYHAIDETGSHPHHHRKKNVKISVRPLKQKTIERRVLSDTCHKGIEPRGYQPFTEPELKNEKSPCMSDGEASFCKEHIYRPVKEQNLRRCDDDFICDLEKRCEDDKRQAYDPDRRHNFASCQPEKQREKLCSEHEKQTCNRKQEQQHQCNEDAHLKKSIRHHEIKIISTCKKTSADYKVIVREKRVNKEASYSNEQEVHLFPFQKTSAGLLKINPSMICYQDGKMCLLVADHSKTKIQFRSTLADVNRKAKSKLCTHNEQTFTAKYSKEFLVDEIVDCTESMGHCEVIPMRDCHHISKRYSSIRKRL